MKSVIYIFGKAEHIYVQDTDWAPSKIDAMLSISVQEYPIPSRCRVWCRYLLPIATVILVDESFWQHGGLRRLRIPATVSTKIVVGDRQYGSRGAHFDVRFGTEGMYNLMRCLTHKARAYEAEVYRRRCRSSHRAKSGKIEVGHVW